MADWKPLARRLLGSWPGHVAGWGEEGIAAYCAELELRGLTPRTALEALGQATGAFPPSAPELAALAAPKVAEASPEAAWALCEEAIRRYGCSIYSPRFDAMHQAAVNWIAEQDPVVAWWAARRGLMQGPGTLGQEPIHDPVHGGAVRHRLGKEYDGVRAEARERLALGESPVPRGALTVAGRGEIAGGMDELVERLRPAAALEAGDE